MKAKILTAAVALADLAGEIVTFLGGLANTTGWDVAKFPCECAWAVLAFPFGWLGWVADSLFVATRSGTNFNDLLLLTGFTMNACLWGSSLIDLPDA